MLESPADFLAQRFGDLVGTQGDASEQDVDRFLRDRGAVVLERSRLRGAGYFVTEPEPTILLRPGADRHARAHETYHLWTWENAMLYGIDYEEPEFAAVHPEEGANRFADQVCGPWWADFWDAERGRRKE